MQIVDRQHQRSALGQAGGEPVQRVQRIDDAHVERRPRGEAEHRAGERGGADQQFLALILVHAEDHGPEQLPHAAEDQSRLQLAAVRTQHRRAVRGERGQAVLHQRRLADARRSLQQKRAAAAGAKLVARRHQLRALGLPLQQAGHSAAAADLPRSDAGGRARISRANRPAVPSASIASGRNDQNSWNTCASTG